MKKKSGLVESTPEMRGKQGEERLECPPSETRWTPMVGELTGSIQCYVGMVLCGCANDESVIKKLRICVVF